jgi:hypothetical protein
MAQFQHSGKHDNSDKRKSFNCDFDGGLVIGDWLRGS